MSPSTRPSSSHSSSSSRSFSPSIKSTPPLPDELIERIFQLAVEVPNKRLRRNDLQGCYLASKRFHRICQPVVEKLLRREDEWNERTKHGFRYNGDKDDPEFTICETKSFWLTCLTCEKTKDEDLRRLAQLCPGLVSLEISEASSLSEGILDLFTALRRLILRNVNLCVPEDRGKEWAKQHPSLRYHSHNLFLQLPRLEQLAILQSDYSCKGAAGLSSNFLPSLRLLKLYSYSEIASLFGNMAEQLEAVEYSQDDENRTILRTYGSSVSPPTLVNFEQPDPDFLVGYASLWVFSEGAHDVRLIVPTEMAGFLSAVLTSVLAGISRAANFEELTLKRLYLDSGWSDYTTGYYDFNASEVLAFDALIKLCKLEGVEVIYEDSFDPDWISRAEVSPSFVKFVMKLKARKAGEATDEDEEDESA